MAHRASQSTSRASLDASFADVSAASLIAPSEAGSESFSEASAAQLGLNKSAIAYLVYHNRGDPHYAGYKQPTTHDIPQVKLPRVEAVDALEVDAYLKQLSSFERLATPASDSAPAPPPLDSVPAMFFDADFHLDNPRVFDAVMREDSVILQEKLSWYVDVVEAHLEKEIAAASSQFFSATASFRVIEEQASGLAQQIAAFKSVVDGIQTGVVAHFEQTAALQTKLRDLEALSEALSQLADFTRTVDSLAVQDPSSVLDDAAAAHRIATQGIDLSRVTVARSYFDKLALAENQARTDASAHLVDALLADLRADEPNSVNIESTMALANRAGVKDRALADYAHAVDLEVRVLVRKQLPGAADDESQGLARSLHTLSAEAAEKMCQRLFNSLSELFTRLQRQPVPLSTIESAVKGADSRLTRVLRVRKDPATTLDVAQFARFFSDVTEFCSKCEDVMHSRPTELSEFLVAQTKFYIHTLHSSSDEKLAESMDSDDWRAAEIPPQVQIAASIISAAGSMDPLQWTGDAKPTGTLRVIVDGQPYMASKSTQSLISFVVKYLQLICVLPTVHVSDTAAALLELLRLFNHKAHHLILGFGAKASAGLKHISVKHLLLTSESLRLVYTLMGSLKRCTERHLPPKDIAVLDSFDAVQQNYFDHRAEIESKLIKLMSDKVGMHSRQIATTNWAVRQSEANRYMQGLMSDTMKVARVAQEMLPQPLSQSLIASIFSAYKPALLEAYQNVSVHSAVEKANLLRDLQYFKTKEAGLNGHSRTGDVIYESVKMFVGPEFPEHQSDQLVNNQEIAARDSPRASTESSFAIDSRQAFAAAVAQGNAQAEAFEEAAAAAAAARTKPAEQSSGAASGATNGATNGAINGSQTEANGRRSADSARKAETGEVQQQKPHELGAELSAAEISAAELKAAELSAAELKAAELSAAELKAAELSAAELSAAEFSAAELRAGAPSENGDAERAVSLRIAKAASEVKRLDEEAAARRDAADKHQETQQKLDHAEAEADASHLAAKIAAEQEAEARIRAEEAELNRQADEAAEEAAKQEAMDAAQRRAEADAAEADAETERESQTLEAEGQGENAARANEKAEEAGAEKQAEAETGAAAQQEAEEAAARKRSEAEAESEAEREAAELAKKQAEEDAAEARRRAEAEAVAEAERQKEEEAKREAEAEEAKAVEAKAAEAKAAEAKAAEAKAAEEKRKVEKEAAEAKAAKAAEDKRKAEKEATEAEAAEVKAAEAKAADAEAKAAEEKAAEAKATEEQATEAKAAEAKRKADKEAAEAAERKAAEAEAKRKAEEEAEAAEAERPSAEAEAKQKAEETEASRSKDAAGQKAAEEAGSNAEPQNERKAANETKQATNVKDSSAADLSADANEKDARSETNGATDASAALNEEAARKAAAENKSPHGSDGAVETEAGAQEPAAKGAPATKNASASSSSNKNKKKKNNKKKKHK